jgi:hypothetical protein
MSDQEVLEQLRRFLSACRERAPEWYGPVSEQSIVAAEQELGVKLPRSYRVFLRNYGVVGGPGFMIDGLTEEVEDPEQTPYWGRIVSKVQHCISKDLPKGYVGLMSDGGEYDYCLDTTRTDRFGECPVVAWGPGADGLVIAKDFLEFLQKVCLGEALW